MDDGKSQTFNGLETKRGYVQTLWVGYLHHSDWNPDFFSDFKDEIFKLILNEKNLYKSNQSGIDPEGYCADIAPIFFIAAGGREMKNMFENKEIDKLIQSMDTNNLECLSRQIWHLLKDSGCKSADLWSEKIKPWIEGFWSKTQDKMNYK